MLGGQEGQDSAGSARGQSSSLSMSHSTRLSIRQAQVDKLYAGLKELAGERRERLQEHLRLCQLRRELDDLEQWIQEREVVAASHELGQDYEHVTVSVGRTVATRGLPGRGPAPHPGWSTKGQGRKTSANTIR